MGFWPQTIERWKKEGLPKHLNTSDDVTNYFGIEPGHPSDVTILYPYFPFTRPPFDPYFEEEILKEEGETIIYRSKHGIIYQEYKIKRPTYTPSVEWLDNPVKDRESWEKIKWRLDADNRRWPNWAKLREKYTDFPHPICLGICGAFGTPRSLLGDYTLLIMYYKNPQLIHDILAHWIEFYKKLTTKVIRNLRVDYICLWEDMAYKKGPMISPRLFKEFISPYYRELIDHLKHLGIKIFMVDSDGNNLLLLDLFLEAGVNAMEPFEIAAGQDPLTVREKYGDRLAILGGIDKRVLARTKKEIKNEVMTKVPQLLEGSGYIPFIDHNIPPNVSLENFLYYLKLIRSVEEQ